MSDLKIIKNFFHSLQEKDTLRCSSFLNKNLQCIIAPLQGNLFYSEINGIYDQQNFLMLIQDFLSAFSKITFSIKNINYLELRHVYEIEFDFEATQTSELNSFFMELFLGSDIGPINLQVISRRGKSEGRDNS